VDAPAQIPSRRQLILVTLPEPPSDDPETNALREDLQAQMVAIIRRQVASSKSNFDRIARLLEASAEQPDFEDRLRAAVVFMHATLEDLLRTIGQASLPNAPESVLNNIPLFGSKDSLRAEKFWLGRLAGFRGRLVDDVITESVRGYLERLTFNTTTDVSNHLVACGFEQETMELVTAKLPEIGELMKRRHQIVHRSDVPPGASSPQPIDVATVKRWLNNLFGFLGTVSGGHAFIQLQLQKHPALVPRPREKKDDSTKEGPGGG
jgi:hypothetical protein